MNVAEIAQIYSVTERSIWKYLRRVRELFSRSASNINLEEVFDETGKIFELIRAKAMRHFQLSEENMSVKLGYLNTALKVTERLVQVYQEVGVLKKVPERLVLEELIPFEDPEVRRAYLGFLKLARQKGEKNWVCYFFDGGDKCLKNSPLYFSSPHALVALGCPRIAPSRTYFYAPTGSPSVEAQL
jgi:hypothetical protein